MAFSVDIMDRHGLGSMLEASAKEDKSCVVLAICFIRGSICMHGTYVTILHHGMKTKQLGGLTFKDEHVRWCLDI